MPAIAHWEFNHFVVVERWSLTAVTIVDPAVGRRRLSSAEFDAGFTGVILTLTPGPDFAAQAAAPSARRRHFWGYLRRQPGMLAQVLAASLVLQVLGLALPLISKVVVDDVLPAQEQGLLRLLGVGMVILIATQLVATYLRSTLLVYLQARFDAQLMQGFFERLLSLPYRFFERRTSGDLMARMASNAEIREVLASQTTSAVLDGGLAVVYLTVVFTQDIAFGALVLAVGLLQGGLILGWRGRMHELTQRELVADANSQAHLVETLTGIATLKASGAEGLALDRWSRLFAERSHASSRRSHAAAAVDTALSVLRTAAPLALLWIGTLRVLGGDMSLGTMFALSALGNAALTPIASVASSWQRLHLLGAHLDRLAEVLDADPEQDPTSPRPAPRLSGQIDLDRVGFRYDSNSPWVLRDISLSIRPGQKIALVGRTGSGKSTLAKLLLGLYEPTEGAVQYDGYTLRDIDLRATRRQFGVVLQDPILFGGSIRENIAFNDPAIHLDQVVEAARLAGVDADIERLPMGYETLVGEGGGALSGGQRQRIALARALATRPAVLLLDEATSNLDVATEAVIERNLRAMSGTRLVIAHRLSTVRDADTIFVLEDGRIAEQGTHDDLLALGGIYARLIRAQSPVMAHDGETAPSVRDVPIRHLTP